MQASVKGIAEIAGHEAIVTSPYKDSVGVWTFGIGHTASAGPPDPARMEKGKARPINEAIKVFADDLAKFERRVNKAVKVPVDAHQNDALTSFDFNTGGIHRAQLTKKLNAGDKAGAAKAFLGWLRPPEIETRRREEMNLFKTGTYANGGMASIYPADARGRVLWSKGRRVDVSPFALAIRGGVDARHDARKEGQRAGGSAAGGAGSGGASQAPVDAPWIDPALVDIALVGAVVLGVAALIFAARWWRARQVAEARDRSAAYQIERAPTVEGAMPRKAHITAQGGD